MDSRCDTKAMSAAAVLKYRIMDDKITKIINATTLYQKPHKCNKSLYVEIEGCTVSSRSAPWQCCPPKVSSVKLPITMQDWLFC